MERLWISITIAEASSPAWYFCNELLQRSCSTHCWRILYSAWENGALLVAISHCFLCCILFSVLKCIPKPPPPTSLSELISQTRHTSRPLPLTDGRLKTPETRLIQGIPVQTYDPLFSIFLCCLPFFYGLGLNSSVRPMCCNSRWWLWSKIVYKKKKSVQLK